MTWDELQHLRVRVPDHVVYRALAQETVLLNVRTSTYHSIDEVGTRFFDVLLRSPSAGAACTELAGEYEVEPERIAADMVTFCADLEALDLILVDGSAAR